MTKFKCLIAAAFALISVAADASTIYECRAYNGSNFFSNNVCSQSKGIGIINHTVPDNMTFDQQVKIVEAAKAKEAARAQEDNARWTQPAADNTNANQSKAAQCQQLDAAVSAKDSELRQPHSPQWGDYLTGERKKLMDQRFALRC